MKKIYLAVTALMVSILLSTSCKMETTLYNQSDASKGAQTVEDLEVKLNGALKEFAGYRFMGRNAVALADMAGDIAIASTAKGHFVSINTWTFIDTDAILNEIYTSGYVVIHNCTLGIIDAEAMYAAEKDEAQKEKIGTRLSQFYALKAMTYFYLANIYAKAYGEDHLNELGLVLVPNDAVIAPKVELKRATVKATWDEILNLLEKAKSYPNTETSVFYPNATNIAAFEARVHLYMHNYDKALQMAEEVFAKGVRPIEKEEEYMAQWRTVAPSPEDIFTLPKSDNDNLSAYSLNTLYGSYNAKLTPFVVGLFAETDYRAKLILTEAPQGIVVPHPAKFDGTESAQAVSNIPIIRTSDLYLMAAEAAAEKGDVAKATEYLTPVAMRNSAASIPNSKDELLKFIAEERVRELFTEGHRFYDLRRTQATATINGVEGYKPYTFVFPIPQSEINSGFMKQQNEDWSANMPKK